MSRMTIKNGDRPTYRAPIGRIGQFTIDNISMETALFGDLINRLGQYEDIGDPEELAELASKKNDTS